MIANALVMYAIIALGCYGASIILPNVDTLYVAVGTAIGITLASLACIQANLDKILEKMDQQTPKSSQDN